MKMCPASLDIGEMQIKTVLKWHFAYTRMATVGRTGSTNAGVSEGRPQSNIHPPRNQQSRSEWLPVWNGQVHKDTGMRVAL